MILMAIVMVVLLVIYIKSPLIGKIALIIANSIIPDPIPFVDEFIMWVGLFMHLNRLYNIANFLSRHKKKIGITVLVLLAGFLVWWFVIR